MKAFWRYWNTYHSPPPSAWLYVSIGLWIAILFVFNYTLDFEDQVIDAYAGKAVRWLWYFLYNGVGYLGALLLVFGFRQMKMSTNFWVLLIAGLVILSFDRSAFRYLLSLREWVAANQFQFTYRVVANVQSLCTLFIPLLLLWRMMRGSDPLGLQVKAADLKLYAYLFLFMVLIIGLASFLPDIQEYYPVYRRAGGARWAKSLELPEWWAVLLFELSYIIDFISVELFFRGFLVIGMAKYLGKDAILPMITIYAMLHFGKPLGEALSSVVGGYILGVLAYESRSIMGGILLHAGIALLMELFAFMHG